VGAAQPPSIRASRSLYRSHTDQLVDGATLGIALTCRRIAERSPRHNH
jgi:dihydroxy-acid dehydratase